MTMREINIMFFCIVMAISVIGYIIVAKMKLPCWKLQIGGIIFSDVLAVILLVSQLACA